METKHCLDLEFTMFSFSSLQVKLILKNLKCTLMTFPKPFPGNCSSSYSHFTRDFAVTTGGMRSRAQALRVPVDKSGMIAHHPLRFHHSFQLLVCRSLNYRVWPVLKINVRVTKMRTNGVFLRSLSNYEEEGLKKVRIQKRFKKLWKVRIHILAWTLSTQEEKLPKSFQKI